MKWKIVYAFLICLMVASCSKDDQKTGNKVLSNQSKPLSIHSNNRVYQSYILTADPTDHTGTVFLGTYHGHNFRVNALSYDFVDFPNDANGVPAIGNAVITDVTSFIDQTYVKGGSSYYVILTSPPATIQSYGKDLNTFETAYSNWFQALPDDVIPPQPGPPDVSTYIKSSYLTSSGAVATTSICKLIRVTGGYYALADPGYPAPLPLKPSTDQPHQGIIALAGLITDPSSPSKSYYVRGSNGYVTSIAVYPPSGSSVTGFTVTGTYTNVVGTHKFSFIGQVTRADGSKFPFNVVNQDLS